MTHADALAYLHSLRQFGFQPGLDTTRRLAAAAGDPHRHLRFIHVAGTNGKGSTCAMLESVYRTAGFRVGLYTSPHLVHFGERIQVNRQPLPEADLGRLVGHLREHLPPGLEPTFFEFTTVLALLWFAARQVDVVIWETGLGGRLDATNIVTPLASVITNIGWDHMHVLGHTLAAIASEKAGIIKPGIPALTATDAEDARAVIEFRARELDAPFIHIGPAALAAMRFDLPLLGAHQRINATLAAATVRLLRFALPVSDDQLRTGLETVTWPGRLQIVQRGPQTWLLDGAHNRNGIAVLKAALQEHFAGRHPTLILGMLADKEWRDMARELTPLASRILTVPVASSRTVAPDDLRTACQHAGVARPVRSCPTVADALRAAGTDPFVLVTGSLYLVGEMLEALGIDAAPPGGNERALNEWSPTRRVP
jgi:dihydrofolate synthase / folylpolyglutamate synthase